MAIQLKSQNVTNMYTPIELVTTNITIAGYGGGGVGGYTDHGYLNGLGDNDHPQYQLTASNSVILGPYQLTANNSLSLGTGATVSFEHTSQSTNFVAISNSTLYAHRTHIHGAISIASTDGTGLTYSSASSGLSLSIPNFITTGALSDHSHGAVNTVTTAGTNLTLASASDGLTVAVPAFITTAYGGAIQGSGTYSQNTGTIQFVNSNGVSFGLSNNGVMTASIAGTEIGVLGLADSTATLTNGTMHFANSNGVGFGLSGSTLTASYTVPGATVFSNSNNVEFGLSGSTITALALVNQTLQTSNVHNVSLSGNTAGTMTEVSSGTMTLIGGNNITLSQSGNKISIIGEVQGGIQTGISGLVVSNTTYTSGSVYYSAQNNITLGSYVSSDSQYIRLSVGNYLTTAAQVAHTHGSNISFGNTSNSTESVVRASSSSNGLTMVIPSYLTTAMQSASSSVFAKTGFTTQSTSGTNVVGTLNTNGINLGIPKWITTAGTGNLYFVDSNGITWDNTVDGVSTSISAMNGPRLSHFAGEHDRNYEILGLIGDNSLSIKRMYVPYNVTGTAMKMMFSLGVLVSSDSATTASENVSLNMGIYTLNGSTLSLASSGSALNSFAWSHSDSSTANISVDGIRQLTVPINVNLTPGEYWIGAVAPVATTYTNCEIQVYGCDLQRKGFMSPIGDTTLNYGIVPFQGIYTVATTAMPSSIVKTNLNYTSLSNLGRANFYNAIYNNTY